MASWLEVEFAGQALVLDAALSLYWAQAGTLVVSDLHLEKSTFLAQFGSSVAPYDTVDTLGRLDGVVARYKPRHLVLLGDSFHDRGAWERLEDGAKTRLLRLCASVETCCFVEGNHDRDVSLPDCLCFEDERVIDGIILRHEPEPSDLPQIVGHFHPKARVNLRGYHLSGKCFTLNRSLLIMPAFGSFTGGLDLNDPVFANLSGGDPFRPYLVHKNTVAAVRLIASDR